MVVAEEGEDTEAAAVSELSSLSGAGRPSLLLRAAAASPPRTLSSPHWYLSPPLQASLLDGAAGMVSIPFSRPPAGGGVCGRARHLFRGVLAYSGPGLLVCIGYM
jgi:hypothetical protein